MYIFLVFFFHPPTHYDIQLHSFFSGFLWGNLSVSSFPLFSFVFLCLSVFNILFLDGKNKKNRRFRQSLGHCSFLLFLFCYTCFTVFILLFLLLLVLNHWHLQTDAHSLIIFTFFLADSSQLCEPIHHTVKVFKKTKKSGLIFFFEHNQKF
jgi:hypothetical protein